MSRGTPVSVRNLVRQATIQVAGEDETTELRTEFWITVIIVFLWTLILIGLLSIILILIFL